MAGHFSSLIETEAAVGSRIPLTVLTGFLGSGKTTLLNLLLREPDLHGTAVVVNEFGSVGIDHDLIVQTGDDTVLLANGCVCCTVRGDLVDALDQLGRRTDPPVDRVLIETSGLAEPGPILRSLMGEPRLRGRFVLSGVACTVDSVLAEGTLDRHPESVQQVAVADQLFLTKTDLQGDENTVRSTCTRLSDINSDATVHVDRRAQLSVLRRLVEGSASTTKHAADALPYRSIGAPGAAVPLHRDGISSFTIVRDEPLSREAFSAWLDMVIAARGKDLLRVKGLVQLSDRPDRPLVIHGVQHLFEEPLSLPEWPSADHRTRIVFITRGIDAEALGETLDVLVRRHLRRRPDQT